ncbi:glycoside hydrolase family 47 protein [Conidiobolus coronatus NRRL 28638]|uniref:alpha-1,2-Mannosidase n=1 Tax=Conidiobolus coronatus (strain ATCC 28846 / CBS 209.66 / NRRL 28638) TaxID=796925 RepID=A0A137PGN1_CONC2|nr:glycoside hydrolase family 47 protein [Conidiobolus coronatus NRRL 28638]|eukprot:KXN74157.1 glycoside hydrolase family 47 protein [Conidiobolus coronatus NRRL 28638]
MVVKAFKHAWSAYERDAWGMDEYFPIRKEGHNFVPKGFGFTIIDSMDTMVLMGLEEEYQKARDWVVNELTFAQDEYLNVFETTIRVLGGILSSHFLTGSHDQILIDKATDLADRLMGSFGTKSGIPGASLNLITRQPYPPENRELTSTSEATTIQLEFKYLSHITNQTKYFDAVEKVNDMVEKLPKIEGLVPIFLDPETGGFSGVDIRLGSRGDSYYEYLLKQYLLTDGEEPNFRRMYDLSIEGMKKVLLRKTYPTGYLFFGEITTYNPKSISPQMDHLVCFLGGTLALGATGGKFHPSLLHKSPDSNMHKYNPLSRFDEEALLLGEHLTETCWATYTMHPTKLASEITVFNTDQNNNYDTYVKPADVHNLLRPETIESLFILYRITKNPIYRERGWEMFLAFETHCKVETGGYTSLKDSSVVPPILDDKMETFFLAETLKYFYLLFSSEDFFDIEKLVLNTEAHPLPKFNLK